MSPRSRVLAILIFCVLSAVDVNAKNAAWGAAVSSIDDRIAAEERRKRELDQKLESYRNSIRQMKVKENDMLVQIDRSQQATEKAKREITVLELQMTKLQNSILALDSETVKARNAIDDLTSRLKQRVVDIYKYGSSEELLAFFAAEDAHDALDSAYLMRKLAEYDRSLIEQLMDKRQEIDLSRQTIEDHYGRLQSHSLSLERERQKYNSTIKQTNTYLNDIRRQKALAERAAKEMEDAQAAVGRAITELMRQRRERDDAAKRAGKAPANVDYLKDRAARGRGSMFDWPVRGPLSSPFGQRVHPVFKTKSFHSGLDIAAPKDTPVKAAAPGEVLFVGWMRGYGQVVIIDHGRNYSTVYAHMSSTRVREGAVVSADSVIGTVGNTGTATGYHLHFEVREGSTAKSPLNYLKR